ncbi:MAG: hypothetical protein M3014_12145, partial [Chloroflexota bacterium]|nr:hypothetical protein [Chloroflexota bacterium]
MYRFDTTISSTVNFDEGNDPSGEAQGAEIVEGPLSEELLGKMNRYWQAANYLTIGQIYLQENPL